MAFAILAFIGLLGGLSSGLFGIGGGTVFVPLLILLRGFDPHVAIGTSIVVIVPTAMMAAFKHASADMVDWKTVIMLLAFAVIGAWIGSVLSLKLNVVVLRRLFALLLLLTSLKLFFQN